MRRLVTKLEQRDIAGVCIEDKQFPKTNSFIDGERQPLADVDEFCGKDPVAIYVDDVGDAQMLDSVESWPVFGSSGIPVPHL
ncbi:MAG TPA: hypothetical protein EYQ00_13820 [Dehalococcoidia bacterium]|nr:hypothetical protein [Dehalococcoidia bacterium]